ncbi:hydroxymethylglutaryl-CoA lyase [Paracoccus laeviglucosivorans]|uniref:Hydroxymethylglutaryl-CoA lyase n=1 Tax=Paracoccus laeviglucosivorans TaxID=1197861 RepID=A0A521BBI3_9RHOB|nr:hydroxymethylglutaryl-CoA lyase [Paracoccus laeviglucosivorans]SMO44447.1 hydroxymethylglutaryl-CoA lyase [Paracoccus laeviglucosivorans]
MAEHVTIYEVGPRDGLQNEPGFVPTPVKIELIELLSQTGLTRIEAASFVSPKWVPQMADAADVMAGIHRHPGIRYAALTPNMQGFAAAQTAKADEVAIFASASEGFSRKNINCSIAESLERFALVAMAARQAGIHLRGYVSCVVECPYDGPVAPEAVARVAQALLDAGCYEVSLGDTIGRARPEAVDRLLRHLTASIAPARLAGHFHDTNGQALENVAVALTHGLRSFDSAIGGLGGCPYAPGARGNVSTLPLVRMLMGAGWETGLDLAALEQAEAFMATRIAPAPKSAGGPR